MPSQLIISAICGIAIGFLYALLFKKQTKSLIKGFSMGQNPGKLSAIGQHIFFLVMRFLIIIGIIFALHSTGRIDLQTCSIFIVAGFLLSLFVHTKRML